MSGGGHSQRTRERHPIEVDAGRWHELYKTLEEVKGSPHAGANFLSFHRDHMVASYQRLLELGLDLSDIRRPRVVPVPIARHPQTKAAVREWEAEISFRIDQHMLSFSVAGVGANVIYSAVGNEPLVEVLSGYVAGRPAEVSKRELASWVSPSNLEVLALACSLWLLEPTGAMRSSAPDLDSACFDRMLHAFELNPLVRINLTSKDATKPRVDRLASSNAMAGWSLANLSLKGDPGTPLRRALGAEVPYRTQYERLLLELPSASLIAWKDRTPEEPLHPTGNRERNLVRRVAEFVEKAGNEDASRPGKLTHATFGMSDHENEGQREAEPRETDELLEEFELRETAQQQLKQIEEWAERANLSEKEMQVYVLDSKTQADTKEIARRLGTAESTVRVQRRNYVTKIRKAAGF